MAFCSVLAGIKSGDCRYKNIQEIWIGSIAVLFSGNHEWTVNVQCPAVVLQLPRG